MSSPKVKTKVPIIVAFGVTAILVAIKLLGDYFLPPLIKNFSSSEKKGFYRLYEKAKYTPGELVVISFPKKGAVLLKHLPGLKSDTPLLKRLVGKRGDRVCHSKKGLFINEKYIAPILSKDKNGIMINGVSGCYTLEKGEALVINTYSEGSFDSRYFGPILTSSILGKASELFTF